MMEKEKFEEFVKFNCHIEPLIQRGQKKDLSTEFVWKLKNLDKSCFDCGKTLSKQRFITIKILNDNKKVSLHKKCNFCNKILDKEKKL